MNKNRKHFTLLRTGWALPAAVIATATTATTATAAAAATIAFRGFYGDYQVTAPVEITLTPENKNVKLILKKQE